MTLRGYIAKRFVYTLILIFFVMILNWVIFELMPGLQGSFQILQSQTRTTPEQYQRLIEMYGLNKPPLERFLIYLKNLATFQFGYSYQTGHLVSQDIVESNRLNNTLLLIGSSTVLSIVIGVFLGIVAAPKRGGSFDNFWVTTSLVTYSLPTFWMGIVFISLFAIYLGWFPSGGVVNPLWSIPEYAPKNLWEYLVGRFTYLFGPMVVLTLFSYGGFLLLTRATMMETLSEDYVLTAKAKGLSQRIILFKHAFKNASLPIVTATALSFGGILGGAIITETVFNWKGLGFYLWNAIGYKDFPVMQAMFFLIALGTIIANFISDLVYGIIDPRIKY